MVSPAHSTSPAQLLKPWCEYFGVSAAISGRKIVIDLPLSEIERRNYGVVSSFKDIVSALEARGFEILFAPEPDGR